MGSNTSSTLTTTAGAVTNTSMTASLSLSNLPTGITGWLSTESAAVPAATPTNPYNSPVAGKATVTLYLVAGPNAVPGSYPVTVTGVDNGYSVSTVVTLTVTP